MKGFDCTRCKGTDFKRVTFVSTQEHEGIVCPTCKEELNYLEMVQLVGDEVAVRDAKSSRAPWTGLAAHPSERAVLMLGSPLACKKSASSL